MRRNPPRPLQRGGGSSRQISRSPSRYESRTDGVGRTKNGTDRRISRMITMSQPISPRERPLRRCPYSVDVLSDRVPSSPAGELGVVGDQGCAAVGGVDGEGVVRG